MDQCRPANRVFFILNVFFEYTSGCFLQKIVIALKKGMTTFFLEEEHERWIVACGTRSGVVMALRPAGTPSLAS